MPALQANASSFKLNTDYPFDKIIYLKSGSFTVPNNSMGYLITIPHQLPFIPLCGGNWSFNADFAIAYEYSTGNFPATSPGFMNDTITNVYSDATNIYLSTDNVNAASKLLYYRIFAFAPSNDNSVLTSIASQGDTFLLNTDYNNTKVLLSDFIDLPATGGSSVNVTVVHGVGTYIPQVIGWITNGGYVSPVGSSNFIASTTLLSANFTNLNFTIAAFTPAQRAYYRVYLDA